MQTRAPPLPIQDFQRIAQVVLGVIAETGANPRKSCLYFACMGAAILNHGYKIPAQVVVGQALVRAAGGKTFAFCDDPSDSTWRDGEPSFHAWVESPGWVLDFSCIAWPLIAASAGFACPAFMFQKRLAKAASTLAELGAEGDFHLLSDPQYFLRFAVPFLAQPARRQLIEGVARAYKKPPRALTELHLEYGGSRVAIVPSRLRLTGTW